MARLYTRGDGLEVRNDRRFNRGEVVILIVLTAIIAFGLGARFDGIVPRLFRIGGQSQVSNQGLPENLNYDSVEAVYDELRARYDGDLTENQLLDGLKQGLAEATGDPYTVFLNAEQAKQFQEDLNGTFTGIGAELGKRDGQIVIIAPIESFPAEKAGVRPRDAILKINDEETFNMTIEDAVSKIRGEKGTQVKLTLLRGGETVEITITREEITVPSVESEVLEGSIGYLQVSRFSDDTVRLARTAAEEFKRQNVRGVILDLRNNGGGLLDVAVDLSGIWLNDQVVVEQKRGGKTVDTHKSGRNAILENVPLAVLVNEGSASASEIVAGALKDYGVGRLFGAKTYGKGSVQALEEVNGGVLKVTIARWFTPKGSNIDHEGITPDETVERTNEDIEADRDPQKDRALDYLKR